MTMAQIGILAAMIVYLGGFLAASITDFIQSIIMTIALLIVLFFAVKTAGGMGAVIDNAKGLAGYFTLTATHDPVSGTSSPYGPITILSTMAWGL